MSEVLSSIRYIKFMAYERAFEQRILRAREEEIRQQRNNYLLHVAFNFVWGASPVACVLVSFLVFTKGMHRDLTPSVAFTSLAIFNELRYATNVLPYMFITTSQGIVSLKRIEKHLGLADVENIGTDAQLVALQGHVEFPDPAPPVAFVNATITWSTAEVKGGGSSGCASGTRTPGLGNVNSARKNMGGRKFAVTDLMVDFPVGELSLVCGPLGSGKTLLLLALLGEADLLSGQIVCPRSPVNTISIASEMHNITEDRWLIPVCAYVPQSAWLLNASIQDNILFGLPLAPDRYKSTLEACSLLSDLAILEDGDQTEIGEKGVNLSGGQKARVSLARAVYSRASYLFLDDVLSAVDAHTAAHLFEKCLCGPLLQQRTVILVSHHVQLCAPGAKHVLHLDNGMASFSGSAEEYMKTSLYSKEQAEEETAEEKPETPGRKPNNNNPQYAAQAKPNGRPLSSASSSSGIDSSDPSEDENELDDPQKPALPRRLVEEEARAIGKVSGGVWLYYLKANGNVLFWAAITIIFMSTKGMEVLDAYWLRLWSQSYDSQGEGSNEVNVNYYVKIYVFIFVGRVVVGTSQWFILYTGGIRASIVMHKVILRATLRAPLRFFDTMTLGRLLNRFGKDLEQIDSQLPDDLGRAFMCSLGLFTMLTSITAVSPIFFLAFAVLSTAYFHYARLYRTTARELRRLDSVTKSPVYSLYSETIAGVVVIRAFGAPARRVDKNLSFSYYLWCANLWLSLRLELLSALLVGATGLILLADADAIDASIAGFALTFALCISNEMLSIREYTALELTMVAVERIKEHAEIQSEPPEIIEPRPPAGWPSTGEIVVTNLCLRYAPELPRVLHNVSFNMKSGEKIGIVGATGSGKSSLALSFFRFVEIDEGTITIDGLDIGKIGLQDLRSRLTIIPQDPTLLSGTIRSTLDPLNEYPDHEIFDALKRARLLPAEPVPVREGQEGNFNSFHNLETEVSEQGQNFSAGERQLLCLARALLKQPLLILMDEATSSVDYEIDTLITATIAEEFKRSSMLVISHRLRTVIGFDKILVLDVGRLVEFDAPGVLMADPSSHFHALRDRTTGI
ncbi:MAG: hypothetical protein CYPHOPRED_004384 [Cyphobasidiales sp. Tagirdzhanova-0007]|nr:MAG: hypothetical protein CYPHOPRED_004384 [Cyphobasidiales sp. Tagirdzhanova-0007]